MDTELKQNANMQVNTFTGGMNSDSSLDMVKTEQYVFGLNIRITKNALLGATILANTTEGIVTAIPKGKIITSGTKPTGVSIMAVASLNNIGAVITKDSSGYWKVYKVTISDDTMTFQLLFTSTETTDKDRFSVVINREIENVTKLYIADTKHPIIEINLEDTTYMNNISSITNTIYAKEDMLSSNRMYPTTLVKITNKIGGTLKTSLVQYTYRFYNKHGICSRLAPLTSKILIIDSNRNKETGNAEDTLTSVGLALNIVIPTDFKTVFDHIQLYRLSYIKSGQNADVQLIYDASIEDCGSYINVNDTGFESIKDLSIDEFSSLSGQTLVPKVIEQNLGYMFASDIKDESVLRITDQFDTKSYQFNSGKRCLLFSDTEYTDSSMFDNVDAVIDQTDYKYNRYVDINKGDSYDDPCKFEETGTYYGGTGDNISWKFIFAKVPIHEDIENTKAPLLFTTSSNDNLFYLNSSNSYISSSKTLSDYLSEQGLPSDTKINYDEIIGSSKLRSLRRNEVYRYGIVFYTKYGVRSDVLWIADIRTPSIKEAPITEVTDGTLYAIPMGIEFDVTVPDKFASDNNIISYEIVRCEISDKYQKNIMQCVISRPVRQPYIIPDGNTTSTTFSPYYPTCFLTSKYQKITPGYGKDYVHDDARSDTKGPLLIFNPFIQIKRNDAVSKLSNTDIKLLPIYYIYGKTIDEYNTELYEDTMTLVMTGYSTDADGNYIVDADGNKEEKYETITLTDPLTIDNHILVSCRYKYKFSKSEKSDDNHIYNYYNIENTTADYTAINILSTSDVKNPTWEQGFSDIQLNGSDIISGIKQYKAYLTGMGTIMFNNWVSNAMYDLRLCKQESLNGLTDDGYSIGVPTSAFGITATYVLCSRVRVFSYGDDSNSSDRISDMSSCLARRGWIGPGPQCMILLTEEIPTDNILNDQATDKIGTVLCNIQHTAIQYAGLDDTQKQYDVYYGFGNYTTLNSNSGTTQVFDGNIYITPCEIVTLFKTYDFNSILDSLMSSQILYYVPMESVINNFFDYGMNYRNTLNPNLQLEPGDIEGIASQDRPLHLFNDIYSDNSTSNNIFNAQSVESSDTTYPQRVVYSEHKTNGEEIDSWHVFKAVDFIDADSRYGNITNLLTSHDILYYWLKQAFGKLSVNERSLVKDENSNTIQLGQGGVLQRVDYLDVRHGMRTQDYSAIAIESNIFWIDMINKAVMGYRQEVVDYGEHTGVQNIINTTIDDDILPIIHYDVQNQELLCGIAENKQLVFNLKLGVATSIYNRLYDNIIQFDNVLYGIGDNVIKYNYLTETGGLMSPIIEFVVNQTSAITKVFDNQKIVMSRKTYDSNALNEFVNGTKFEFTTDMDQRTELTIEGATDREHNILYPIPRFNNDLGYGCRMRGKWMKVKIADTRTNPTEDFAISCIITKYRQSFS